MFQGISLSVKRKSQANFWVHKKGMENYKMTAGLPWSGKNISKMKFFPGQGKVREFCRWSGKSRKDLESQGKIREFGNKWLWQAYFRKFIYSLQEGKYVFSHEIV